MKENFFVATLLSLFVNKIESQEIYNSADDNMSVLYKLVCKLVIFSVNKSKSFFIPIIFSSSFMHVNIIIVVFDIRDDHYAAELKTFYLHFYHI